MERARPGRDQHERHGDDDHQAGVGLPIGRRVLHDIDQQDERREQKEDRQGPQIAADLVQFLGGDGEEITVIGRALISCLAAIQSACADSQRVEAYAFGAVNIHQAFEILEPAIETIPVIESEHMTAINVIVARS